MASTVKVIRNKISPRAIRAERCISEASPNSLAMVEANVEPESNRDYGKRCEVPMTKVTAMVSPKARPKPSMTTPIIPF